MNKFLEKIATTRLIRELAKGTVSKPLHELIHSGSLRSPGMYAKGMKKGNIALASKQNQTFQKAKPGTIFEYFAQGGGGYGNSVDVKGRSHIMHLGNKAPILESAPHVSKLQDGLRGVGKRGFDRQEKDLIHQAFIRHEVYEGAATNKLHPGGSGLNTAKQDEFRKIVENETPHKHTHPLKRYAKQAGVPEFNGVIYNPKHSNVVGRHAHLSVLGQESNMIRKNPYLHHSLLSEYRRVSGEAELISKITGKRHGVDKLTSKDFKKLDRAKPDPATGMHVVG